MITVIEPTFYWPKTTLDMFPFLVEHVERCGRICYKSEKKITPGSADMFVEKIRKSQHLSVLEHASVTAIVIGSRAMSHQLVRHRIAAYSQESMRYCNYGKNDSLQVICPPSIGLPPGDYLMDDLETKLEGTLSFRQCRWVELMDGAYYEYKCELDDGIRPEDARFVLPNATKTELAVTFNLRQWRHVFMERALNKHAQWEIRDIFSAILRDIQTRLPSVFVDLGQQSPGDAAIDVLKALFDVCDLGDMIYDIREREGEGWDGPLVVKWGDAVTRAETILE